MEKFKKIMHKILFPPVWITILLIPISASGLIYIFYNNLDTHPLAAVTYAVSAYTLTIFCTFAVKVLPGIYRKTRRKINNHPLGNKYMTDTAFKVRISLYVSLTINIAYSVFKLFSGVLYSSFWWGAVAVYYIILSLLRFILLRYMKKDESKQGIIEEHKLSRICGIMLLLLNLSLTGIIFQMVWQNQSFSYPGFMIFAAAAYTFYTVIVSVIDMVKYRQFNSPIISASKAIRFAAALVSLLSLETAMLAQFGTDNSENTIMIALTGAGVCIIVLTMSLYMIVKASKEIAKQ